MSYIRSPLQCDYTVCCKKCGENIPASVMTVPDDWIAVRCLLCGEYGHYLPAEIFHGRLSFMLYSALLGKAGPGTG